MLTTSINTVHLIGLGAVGANYGSFLYKMDNHCIKIILDENRLAGYRQGIIVNGEKYDFDLTVPKLGDPKAEFIIVAVKGHHLQNAIQSITPLVGEKTIILTLLNGITSEDDLAVAFGKDKVLHGFCVSTDATRENNEINFKNSGTIVFGEYFPEATGKAAPVADLFNRAGISYTIPDDIRREMWWKFMLNVGINPASAILKATYGVFATIPEAQELIRSACREVLPLAEKEGINLSEADIADYLEIFKKISPEGKTSMFQDVESGRKTEIESFSLAVMNLGKKHCVSTPVNETLYHMIRVLESQFIK